VKILLLDNYDSFTFNLRHYLQNAGGEVLVVRNDELSPSQMQMTDFDAAVLSPGPCTPAEAGAMMEFIQLNANRKPIFGICLGMQAIGLYFGWTLHKAKLPVHGKSSLISHNAEGIFQNLPNPMPVGRYHSLIITDPGNTELLCTAKSGEEIMGVSTGNHMICGVQFHPESILTPGGQQLIQNWFDLVRNIVTPAEIVPGDE
jgi:anthranilate synthase/aminodeoxychorismate synthase-like glutamine amidotransferase